MASGFTARRDPGATAQSSGPITFPAPIKGINAVDPLAALTPDYCLNAVNMVADGRTMAVRPGYRSFATAVGNGQGVRAIIPFAGSTEAANALFAVCQNGIFNITAGGAGPWTADVTFGTLDTASGYGVWTNFVNDAGSHYAFYADESNGLYRCIQAGTWAAAPGITFSDGTLTSELVFVTQFKARLWLVKRNSATAYYLAPGAIAGAATPFYFGNKFNNGGRLVGLYSWTVDGGEGVDDHLVAISSAGDVMVYKGTDPSSAATWDLVGQFYVGPPPAGRRVAEPQGGDLYILSQYGVIPLTRLMNGALVQQENAQLSRNISPLIATALDSTRSSYGWEMRNVPASNVFLVSTPQVSGMPALQFALSTRTLGWTIYNNLPYISGDVYKAQFYFGDPTTTVWVHEGTTEAADAAGAGGTTIAWSLQPAFIDASGPEFHRVQFLRAVFLAQSRPGVSIVARYDYDSAAAPSPAAPGAPGGAIWDAAIWDVSTWGGSNAIYTTVVGASGIGRAVSFAMRGLSDTSTGLVRVDMILDAGGVL